MTCKNNKKGRMKQMPLSLFLKNYRFVTKIHNKPTKKSCPTLFTE